MAAESARRKIRVRIFCSESFLLAVYRLKVDPDQEAESMLALHKDKNNPEEMSVYKPTLPDPIEDGPITLTAWLVGGAIVLLLLAMLL